MNHDIAYRLSAAWANDPTVRSGSALWTLHLCGVIETGGNRVLHVAACGPCIRWLAVPVPDTPDRLMTIDLTDAIAAILEAQDDTADSALSIDERRWVA